MLQERVSDAVLDHDFFAGLGVFEFAPGSAVDHLRAKLLLRQSVGPITEAAFRVLHDVALVHNGQAGLVVVDGVLQSLAHQALGAFARHGLDADARGVGETDLFDAHLILQELDQFLGLVGLGFELDTGVNVFRIFTEDHHIGLLWLFDRAGHAVKVLDGAQADVQVELLAQSHIQRTDAAAHGGSQGTLDRHHVIANGVQGFFGQPDVRAVHIGRLLAGEHFHPMDLALAAVGLGHGSVHHFKHHRRDVQAGTVAFNVRNDGLVWHVQGQIAVHSDFLAFGGDFDVLVHGAVSVGCQFLESGGQRLWQAPPLGSSTILVPNNYGILSSPRSRTGAKDSVWNAVRRPAGQGAGRLLGSQLRP